MGVTLIWTKGSAQAFVNLPEMFADKVRNEIAHSMAVIVEAAVQNAREFTAERGTANSGHSGRIETSEMIGAIKGEVDAKADQILGKFGFIGEQADYFKYQTITGFHHWLSGEFIEPTYALRDAGEIAFNDLFAAIKAAVRAAK